MSQRNGGAHETVCIKAEDRDQVIVILARNGYTVRQGKEKDPKNNKTVTFVEVIENGK